MFNIKLLKNEDLVMVVTELGLAVKSEHRIIDLKKLAKKYSI